MLKIIGAGLSRTGTRSLHDALTMLGYRSLHFDTERLNDILSGDETNPDFRRYDDVDAVADLPASWFYRELFAAYPGSKVILTVRNVDDWWRSICGHFNLYPVTEDTWIRHKVASRLNLHSLMEDEYHAFRRRLRNIVYGSPVPHEFLYKKRFVDHNSHVVASIPADRLLVIDICGGEGWDKLCAFLGASKPNAPFPHVNRLGEKREAVGV